MFDPMMARDVQQNGQLQHNLEKRNINKLGVNQRIERGVVYESVHRLVCLSSG